MLQVIDFTNCNGNERGNTRFPSTINGAYVSDSKMGTPTMLKSRITTEARCDMSIPNTRERKVRPTHPGEMLREDYLPDYGLTISAFAKALGVSRQTVNELIRERRSVSPEMATSALPVVRRHGRVLAQRSEGCGSMGGISDHKGEDQADQSVECRITSGGNWRKCRSPPEAVIGRSCQKLRISDERIR